MASIQVIATKRVFVLFGASVAQAADDLPSGYVRIEPGRFTMGSSTDEERRRADEVQHEVRIARAFAMKKTEVTQRVVRNWTPRRADRWARPTKERGCTTGGGCTRGTGGHTPLDGGPATQVDGISRGASRGDEG